jgi:hypothetical protein
LALFAAPHDTTTTSPVKVSSPSPWCTTTPVTDLPDAFVSRRSASASVSSVTLGCSSAGRTASTSASDFACTRHGKPSQVAQRTQALNAGAVSSSRTPHGAWNGWRPMASRSSLSCWMRGSCETAGNGYGPLDHGSVGSSPRAPCTWYSASAPA